MNRITTPPQNIWYQKIRWVEKLVFAINKRLKWIKLLLFKNECVVNAKSGLKISKYSRTPAINRIDSVVFYNLCSSYIFFQNYKKTFEIAKYWSQNLYFVIYFEFLYRRDEMIVIAKNDKKMKMHDRLFKDFPQKSRAWSSNT